MFNKFKWKRFFEFTLLYCTFAVISIASANTFNTVVAKNLVIPAAACSPKTPKDFDKIELSNASWKFLEKSTGSVTLLCPASINFNYSAYEVFFRDCYNGLSSSNNTAGLFVQKNKCNISSRILRSYTTIPSSFNGSPYYTEEVKGSRLNAAVLLAFSIEAYHTLQVYFTDWFDTSISNENITYVPRIYTVEVKMFRDKTTKPNENIIFSGIAFHLNEFDYPYDW